MTTILFYDLETTGLDAKRNAIHQIGGILEVDGYMVDQFDIRMRPHAGAVIDPKALAVSNVTKTDIMAYEPASCVPLSLRLNDRCTGENRIHLAGWNNIRFDDEFLREWCKHLGKPRMFNYWFWPQSIDVMVLATYALRYQRHQLKDFKLSTVAAHLGCIREGDAHEAMSDIKLTREVYKTVCYMLRNP